ncbi:WxcM-like domain-containing protein [uncultured Aquimarina sp.]|uniref:WxcM-like domain-containing protein n=1 Tax=uncultured Aquimarina sp. TaxID=575652 RepID=UPI002639059E|nr:WxcM-like domain-containing protein [uncultured Aquimarina sp.]
MNTNKSNIPSLIEGGKHSDERGDISYVNDFSLENIKRFYSISHPSTKTIRAWQGHKKEPKYFYAVSGSFWIACVKIDNWSKPSENLKVDLFKLNSEKTSILYIPPGYANGIKAIKEESKLISFCEDSLEDSSNDNYRYDYKMWLDWNNLESAY